MSSVGTLSKSLIAAVMLITAVGAANAMTGGIEVSSLSPKEYQSAVILDISGTGTAVYIGDGIFITAAHNIMGAAVKQATTALPYIEITQNRWKDRIKIGPDDYELYVPPTDRWFPSHTEDGLKLTVPEPDLAIIKLKDVHRSKVQSYRSALFSQNSPDKNSDLVMVGAGSTSYHHEPAINGVGLLRYGKILYYQELDEHFLTAAPLEYPQFSCPGGGDSGGPVFMKQTDGSWKLVGITSRTVKSYTDKDKKIAGYIDAFVNLTQAKTSDWIQNVIAGKILPMHNCKSLLLRKNSELLKSPL